MSIEVIIFPTILETVNWEAICTRWQQQLGDAAITLLGAQPHMHDRKTPEALEHYTRLIPEHSYYFELAVPNTLGLMAFPNTKRYIYEEDCLEDYGHNLSREQMRTFTTKWQTAGHHYEISSFAGRGPQESRIFAALATAVAAASHGYVIVMHDYAFDLGVGVYTSQEFSHARPKF